MRRLAILLILGLCAAGAAAQEFKRNATAGFVFLEVPPTARMAALGEATTALGVAGADGVFLNPAGVGRTERTHSVSFSYAPWIADISHYAGAYAWVSGIGTFAISVTGMDYGSIPRTVRGGGQRVFEVQGEYSASSLCAGLTYAGKLTEQFSFGVSVKYATESIAGYSAGNAVFDGGVLYNTGLGSFRIAGALQNFGTDAKFVSDPFRMPALLRLGVAGEVLGGSGEDLRLTLSADAQHPTDADERVAVGLEAAWRETVALRAGYKFFYDEETFSLGIGLALSTPLPMGVDFAYSDYGRLGDIVRVTLHAALE